MSKSEDCCDLVTWMMFLPPGEVVEVIMDPPQSLTVVLVSLGFQPLSSKLPSEDVSVMEIFVSRVLSPRHG